MGPTLGAVARHRRGDLLRATVFAVARQLAFLLVPLALQRALDRGVLAGDVGAALRWAAAVLALTVLQAGFMAGWTYWTNVADTRTSAWIRTGMAERLAGLDRGATQDLGAGDVVMRATRDADLLGAWVHGRPALWVIGTTFAFVLPALAGLDPVLLLVGLAMIPAVTAVTLYHRPRLTRAHQGLSRAHGERADAVEDLLSAGPAVRGLGGEQTLVDRHHERSARLSTATMRAARTTAAWGAQGAAVPRIAIGVGLLAGGQAVLGGRMTVGGLVAFTSWMMALEMATHVLVDRLADRAGARVALERIGEVLAARPVVTEVEDPVELPRRGELMARRVRYRDGEPGVDLTVGPGTVLVVAGPTGSGKSSLLRVLARAADPATGTVSFGGVPLRQARTADVGARIVLVPQRPVLLAGSLRECLLGGGALGATDEELLAACRVAVIDDLVGRLPEGLDTRLGERGTTLSGGQRQRIALARAVVRAPEVLLLDDVTSALDPATETELLSRLLEWGRNRTLVLASHRPAVLAVADVVLRLGRTTSERTGEGRTSDGQRRRSA